MLFLLVQLAPNLDDFPRFLRFNPSIRRSAMNVLPYAILLGIGALFGTPFGWIVKCVALVIFFFVIYGYSM